MIHSIRSNGLANTREHIDKLIEKDKCQAAREMSCHLGYVFPDYFIWYYIRNISYRILEFASVHLDILRAIKPGDYGKQVNVQAPRGIGKTTLVNRLIPLWRICYKAFDEALGVPPEEVHPHRWTKRAHGAPAARRNSVRAGAQPPHP